MFGVPHVRNVLLKDASVSVDFIDAYIAVLVITKRLGFAPKDFVRINGVSNNGWQHNYSPPKYYP